MRSCRRRTRAGGRDAGRPHRPDPTSPRSAGPDRFEQRRAGKALPGGVSAPHHPRGGIVMGDKNDRVRGKVKEGVGRATRDRALEEQGRRDQVKGDVKKGGEKMKDAAKKL